MTVILKFLFGFVLGVQAFIGLSFLISSLYEREKRASIAGGFQFLGMLILLVLFFILNSTGFFNRGTGFGILVVGTTLGITTFLLLFLRIGSNPKAYMGTRGNITASVKQWDERDAVFAKMRQIIVRNTMQEAMVSGSVIQSGSVAIADRPYGKGKESNAMRTKIYQSTADFNERVPDDVMNSFKMPGGKGRGIMLSFTGNANPSAAADIAMANACANIPAIINDPDILSPGISDNKIDISPEEATLRIKDYTKHLGADLVGITKLDSNWLYSHYGSSGLSHKEWGKQVQVQHDYAIVFAEEMSFDNVSAAPHAPIILESMRNYSKGAFIAAQLASFIANVGYSATVNMFSHYDALMVPLAVDAGIGELSRMGYLISKEFGPRMRLSAVTTDLPLIPDKPVDIGVQDFCRICRKCAICCPTKSISMDDNPVEINGSVRWKLNADTCFDYWRKVGTDCGICMRVCPWSHARTFPHKLIVAAISKNKISRRLFRFLDDVFYGKMPKSKAPPEWTSC